MVTAGLLASSLALGQQPVQVAFIYPQTPARSPINTYDYGIAGEAGRTGATLAAEQFGWMAQQQGWDFRVLMTSAPNAASAVRSAQRLIQNEEVFALIGGYDSGQALALGELAEERGVLFFNVGSTDREGDIPATTFHLQPSAETYLRAIRHMAEPVEGETWVVVLADDEEGARRLATAEEVIFSESSGLSRSPVTVDPGAPVFEEAVAKIREEDPDAVLLLLDWRLQLEFLGQLESSGIAAPQVWSLPDSVATSREFYGLLRSGAPNSGAGPHLALWDATLDEAKAQELNDLYESHFGQPMDPSAWAAYEAVKLAFEAAVAVGSEDVEGMIDFLADAAGELDVDKAEMASFDAAMRELRQPLYAVRLAEDTGEGSRLDRTRARAKVTRVLTEEEVW